MTIGDRLGPYEILAALGAGGMGEVYSARDTRLNRLVAIKLSHEQFTERSASEARAVAALNHPNIVAIYDVGPNYIVTELVDGKSLEGASFPLRKTLDLAAQIADGLAAAHAAGLVHRDLKPANIMVTREGRVKILDFGLARSIQLPGPNDATRTIEGLVVGTVGYMSPEQVRGEPADQRSDIFSFGCVLYEMLSGQRAFTADTAAEAMTAILKLDPPELAPTISASVRDLVFHCLEKDPRDRFQSAKDLAFALRSLTGASSSGIPVIATSKRHNFLVPAAIGIAAFLAGALLVLRLAPAEESPIDRVTFTPVATESETEDDAQFSPDGKSIAYLRSVDGYMQIFVRSFNTPIATQVTHRSGGVWDGPLCWSPDGARIFFTAANDEFAVGAAGGAAQRILADVGPGAALSPDGKSLVFVRPTRNGAWQFLVSSPPGADPKPMPDAASVASAGRLYIMPFSPDGSRFAAVDRSHASWIIPFPTGRPRRLPSREVYALAWLPDSRHAVFSMGSPDSTWRLVLADTESSAIRTILRGPEVLQSPTVSQDGRQIIYTTGLADYDLLEYTAAGQPIHSLVATSRLEFEPSWSPSGNQFLYFTDAHGPMELWTRAADGTHPISLATGLGHVSLQGRYSPDGRRIAYLTDHNIWVIPAAGGRPVAIASEPAGLRIGALAWSPDGNSIFFEASDGSNFRVQKINSSGGSAPISIHEFSGRRSSISLSPDGHWIVYFGHDGVRVIAADGSGDRLLIGGPAETGEFVPGAADVYEYARRGDDNHWRLISVAVPGGSVLKTVIVDLDPSYALSSFAIHPGGKRMIICAGELKYDLWMLKGFPQPAHGIQRLWSHWVERP
ncbi:MAG TPA: protein kinase [Bryobacteraceae bacterium]|nr:protein kinase [Bryobacteraceae bacterium]